LFAAAVLVQEISRVGFAVGSGLGVGTGVTVGSGVGEGDADGAKRLGLAEEHARKPKLIINRTIVSNPTNLFFVKEHPLYRLFSYSIQAVISIDVDLRVFKM
jgi:hypothetical protein